MEPKFKVEDYVKCNCGCGKKGIIHAIDVFPQTGKVFYWIFLDWFNEESLIIYQEYLNEQKIKKLLGVK